MATPVARAGMRIRQLCCLGLGGPAIMPALLKELHDLIPSYSNAFFWTDEQSRFSNLYDENPVFPRIAPVYINEFYNRRERELFAGFTESMLYEQGVQSLNSVLKIDKKSFYKHDFYDLIYRPLNYRHFIRIVLREQGTAVGRIHLYRADDAEFTAHEKHRLLDIAPFMAHAVTAAADNQVTLVESPDSGLIIADVSGRIQHLSAQARRLLWMAAISETASKPDFRLQRNPTLPEVVRSLYKKLAGVFRDDAWKSPPVWRHRNAWGGFTFRAYWLNDGEAGDGNLPPGRSHDPEAFVSAPEPAPLIAITAQREEPLPLKLLRRAEQLPLSGKQIRVCLLLASGQSLAQIAGFLNVSRHTADYHCREVYARLDVHNRAELIGKLLLM